MHEQAKSLGGRRGGGNEQVTGRALFGEGEGLLAGFFEWLAVLGWGAERRWWVP